MLDTDKIGNILAIGDGTIFRLYCYQVTEFRSYWILQTYKRSGFLWWKWEGWKTYEFTTNYGAGDTVHHFTTKRKDETDEELVWEAEMELDFLGEDYGKE